MPLVQHSQHGKQHEHLCERPACGQDVKTEVGFRNGQELKNRTKNMKIKRVQLAMVAATVFASVATVQASLTGLVYENQNGSGNTDVAPTGSAAARFTMSGLPLTFDSDAAGNGYTIGGWLATGGVTGASVIYFSSGASTATMDNVSVVLTGTLSLYTGEVFDTVQDDGLTVTIDGTKWYDAPGPHSPTGNSFVYGGPNGTESVTISYAEIDGPPAYLELTPASAVPEASTMIAGALLLLPFGASTLRILRRNRMA